MAGDSETLWSASVLLSRTATGTKRRHLRTSTDALGKYGVAVWHAGPGGSTGPIGQLGDSAEGSLQIELGEVPVSQHGL